ncbi:MAG: type II secretion system F family protein [Myxococcota bacterium]
MPVFVYEGVAPGGERKQGELEARDEAAALDRLRAMQVRQPSLKKKSREFKLPTIGGGVTEKDLVVFTRQFATMIDSGLPLVQCLDIQCQQAPNPVFRDQLKVIKETVEGGTTFADALKKFPKTFDTLYVNLVAAGEVGGILDTILNRLAAYIEKASKLKKQVKSAMVYPVAIMVIAAGVVALLLLQVVPVFEKMFTDMGGALPAPTQIVIDMSKWLQANFLFIVVAIVGSIVGLGWFYGTPKGRLIIDTILFRAPVFGEVITKVSVARFCRTLGTMVSSGVPILEALDICSRTAGNKVVENAIVKARDSISEGKTIAEPLMESKVFPDMVVQMISVGEATGALDNMLNKIADFYEEEVDVAVDALTALLEPVMMIFIGGIVGGMLIAMYLPIFTMADNVGGQ